MPWDPVIFLLPGQVMKNLAPQNLIPLHGETANLLKMELIPHSLHEFLKSP